MTRNLFRARLSLRVRVFGGYSARVWPRFAGPRLGGADSKMGHGGARVARARVGSQPMRNRKRPATNQRQKAKKRRKTNEETAKTLAKTTAPRTRRRAGGGEKGRAKMLRSVAAFPSACICVMHLCVTLAAEVRRTLQALCETHQSVRSRYRDALPMH